MCFFFNQKNKEKRGRKEWRERERTRKTERLDICAQGVRVGGEVNSK